MAVTGTNSLLFLLPYEFQHHLSSSSRRQGYISFSSSSSSSSSHSLMKHSVTLYFVHKLHQKRKNFSLLQIQGLQAAAASSTHCPSTTRIPVVYSDDDDDAAVCAIQPVTDLKVSDTVVHDAAVCAIQPVTDLKVSDTVVHDAAAEELLPSSAMAVAAAIGTRFSVVSKTEECKHMLSAASAEFLALCAEQLALCEEIVGPNAKFTVYVRPAESYSTGQFEFHRVAVYPNCQEELLVLKQSDALASITLTEANLIEREVVQVASGTGAVVLPMVKDLFLIGLLVVEGGGGRSVKPGKLKPVRPVWPPRKATSKQSESWATSDSTTNLLNTQQLREIVKVARSLALACVMDQRALLLQKSTWQKGDQIHSLLEQAQGPLQAMRTLSQLLLPQLKRGEISRDFVEDILVQGARMKEVLQQLHNVSQSGPNLVNAAEDVGSKAKVVRQPDSMPSSSLSMHGFVEHEDRGQKQGLLPAAYMEGQDFEAPMPPHTLAPLPDYDPSRPCDVAKVLRQLGKAANGLANQRHQSLQITSSSPLWAAVDMMGLQRVCSHLLDNALHHTPPGGYVRTNAIRAPGGGVLIIIEDNGPHIAMQVGGVAPLAAESRDVNLKNGLDRDEMKFVRDIVELQLGGVFRVQSPHLLNAPCGAGGTRVEIWLPAATDIQLPTA